MILQPKDENCSRSLNKQQVYLTKESLALIVLLVISFVLHFAFLSYPAESVFDEIYFGQFANDYLTHQYYFDIHPPLGKMLIAGLAEISGTKTGLIFPDKIGIKFNAEYLFILRFLPALSGAFLPLLIYLLLEKIGVSSKAAFFGSFLTVFDNALLTQSKFILLDVLLLVFGFSALYFFLVYKKEKNYIKSLRFLATSATLATFSFSIKWTGLSFLGIILLVSLIDLFKKFYPVKLAGEAGHRPDFQGGLNLVHPIKLFRLWRNTAFGGFNRVNFKEAFIKLSILIFIPFVIYYLIFLIHFQILYKSGPGDTYMSSQFKNTLTGNNTGQNKFTISGWQKFVELNRAMYYYNSTLKATHPYSSKWFQWPLAIKPIWYWTEIKDGKVASIYLFGNPVIWWSVLAGIIFSVLAVFVKKIRQKLPTVFWLLLFGYFINILPYIFISRISFLYHYLPSLIFGILILSVLLEKIFAPFFQEKNLGRFIYFGFLFLCFFIFLILTPLNYGFFISSSSGLSGFYNIFIKFFS